MRLPTRCRSLLISRLTNFGLPTNKLNEGQQFNARRTIEYMDQFSGSHLWMPGSRHFTPFNSELDYRNY